MSEWRCCCRRAGENTLASPFRLCCASVDKLSFPCATLLIRHARLFVTGDRCHRHHSTPLKLARGDWSSGAVGGGAVRDAASIARFCAVRIPPSRADLRVTATSAARNRGVESSVAIAQRGGLINATGSQRPKPSRQAHDQSRSAAPSVRICIGPASHSHAHIWFLLLSRSRHKFAKSRF